tara:strand:+ start:673 stop:909 length:237 start_codon:yes stop_codon:yes gene_type:complete
MRLKIKCNGDPKSAVVVNAATDEIVNDVLGVEISMSPFDVEAAIILKNVELELDNIEAEALNVNDTSRDDGEAGTPDD